MKLASYSDSDGEEAFLHFWRVLCADMPLPDREYPFDPTRRWRLDFAWPRVKIAVEIESWGHQTSQRYASDLDKYNALSARGWRLFRITRYLLEGKPDAFLGMVRTAIKETRF